MRKEAPDRVGKRELDFMIVGTPRSGTTLVQRLATELPGVRVPPETHFFVEFAPSIRRPFPLEGATLRGELQRYAALPTSAGLHLDIDALEAELGGRCDNIVGLFGGIVRHLGGNAQIYGEKTPHHLLWWRPLTAAVPGLKLVAVVRDPRAVVASNLGVPWGMNGHVLVAEQWSSDQRQVSEAAGQLGPSGCLVVRYEDVVADPEGSRRALATFLDGPPAPGGEDGEMPSLFHAWEPWKRRASEPVTTERIAAWRNLLSARQIADIGAICRPEMVRFQYIEQLSTPARAATRRLGLGPIDQFRRASFRRQRSRRLNRIHRLATSSSWAEKRDTEERRP